VAVPSIIPPHSEINGRNVGVVVRRNPAARKGHGITPPIADDHKMSGVMSGDAEYRYLHGGRPALASLYQTSNF
jgi:hypothetical protein